MIEATASRLRTMVEGLIPFSEPALPIRVFSKLLTRHQELEKTKDPRAKSLGNILQRKLEPKTQSVLVEHLKSHSAEREQTALQILGCLGPASMQPLIEVIKNLVIRILAT